MLVVIRLLTPAQVWAVGCWKSLPPQGSSIIHEEKEKKRWFSEYFWTVNTFYMMLCCLLCPSKRHGENLHLEWQISCSLTCEGLFWGWGSSLQVWSLCPRVFLTFLGGLPLPWCFAGRGSELQHPHLALELLGAFPCVAMATTQNVWVVFPSKITAGLRHWNRS